MSLSLLTDVLQAPLVGSDAVFTGVSTDSRTLSRGDLFVALQGDNFDGHHFLAEAIHAGASGAVLARALKTPLPYVRVADTRRALGDFAGFWRRQYDFPIIAVTGSNGKTTVKEMIGAILAQTGPGCVTRGNLNNDIGVPLTLLRIRARDRYAVIEMGMNHVGEIEYLTRMTRPTIAVITNAGEAHLEGLGSVERVARAKGEIFLGLRSCGVVVLNADDAYYPLWKDMTESRKQFSFGLAHDADVRAEYRTDGNGTRIHLKTHAGDVVLGLPLLGRHNVMNALAASATALAAGVSLTHIKIGLESLQPVPGRMEIKAGISGARVIDDTYNANPSSLAAALETLTEFGDERVLVLGDMAELGEAAQEVHRHAGELAREIGVQRLFALGDLSAIAVASFGKGGRHFDKYQAVIDAVIDCMHARMTILVKGSRVMRMERIVDGIVRRQSTPLDGAGRTS